MFGKTKNSNEYWTFQNNSITKNHWIQNKIHAFFISNARLLLARNQANAKQCPQAELLLFQNYSHTSSSLSTKNNWRYSKK